MLAKTLMSASEIINYIDNKYGYKGSNNNDHIITLPTWRSWKSAYNKAHRMHPIVNQGSQKTKGSLYSKSDIGKLIKWKKDSLDKLYFKKTSSPFDYDEFTDTHFKNRTPISRIEDKTKKNNSISPSEAYKLEVKIKEKMLSLFDLDQLSKDICKVNELDTKIDHNKESIKFDNPILYLKPSILKQLKENDFKTDIKNSK